MYTSDTDSTDLPETHKQTFWQLHPLDQRFKVNPGGPQLHITPAWKSVVILKSLISWIRCLIRDGAVASRRPVL